jgi:hypothetical protein
VQSENMKKYQVVGNELDGIKTLTKARNRLVNFGGVEKFDVEIR